MPCCLVGPICALVVSSAQHPKSLHLTARPIASCNRACETRHPACYRRGVAMAVEEPKYHIVKAERDFEVRDYPGLVVAEVEVGGDRRTASYEGFRLLAGYIFGGNAGSANAYLVPASVHCHVRDLFFALYSAVGDPQSTEHGSRRDRSLQSRAGERLSGSRWPLTNPDAPRRRPPRAHRS